MSSCIERFRSIPANATSYKRRRLLYGVGVNDADYQVAPKTEHGTAICPYYSAWHSMLTRCYSPKFLERYPTYQGCTVCPEWLTFSNFRRWMEGQNWKGRQLDKDILIPGNKEYAPDRCIFIDQALNKLLTLRGRARGKWPLGVTCQQGRFVAQLNNGRSSKYLGRFDTPEKAEACYLAAKSAYVNQKLTELRGSLNG